jgi:hypothetical protein
MTMAKALKSGDQVIVHGLDDLRRELRRIESKGGPNGLELLKGANYKVATHVIGRAQGRAAGAGRMQARAASTLKAGRAQARATITGGVGVPYFFGAEFGSKSNILRRARQPAGWAGAGRWLGYNQFLPWKQPGGGRAGYFLFPTMRSESAAIVEIYGDELDDIVAAAFPD